jgi:isopenicillin-N N-acyltransferase-like protein
VTAGRARRIGARLLVFALAVGGFALLGHLLIRSLCRIQPPAVTVPAGAPVLEPGLRRLGRSYVVERGALLEVHLQGTPAEVGYNQARLLYPEMLENEGILLRDFREAVPNGLLRLALLDLAQLRYRKLDQLMGEERRTEIAASALGFAPDPYQSLFPTYQRFVYLNALYDIALSFEHSPLVGCTTFVFSGDRVEHGGSLLARAFDFEIEIFDRKKAVFFVEEDGKIPFASVAWPGLIGVVSGMNRAGLALVVHGGRAGETRNQGEPVVHSLRRVLGSARSTEQALAELAKRPPLVSHILIVSDESGRAVRVERVPGSPDHVILLGDARAVTNHFAGPAAADPKNRSVISGTSTVERKRRADELVARARPALTAGDAVRLLRDRRGTGDQPLPLGDRRAIDALIATHGVVMDTKRRVLWVSEAPHLLGRFVAFELEQAFAADYDPKRASALAPIPEDELLTSGDYARHRAARALR